MAKIDIYHYDTKTDVRSVTLSNCDSSEINDYVVVIDQDMDNEGVPRNSSFKPHSVSGSTLTLVGLRADQPSALTDNCLTITVIQQGA